MILASSQIAGCILWRNARLPPPCISDSGHRVRKSTRLSHQGPASEIKATVSPDGRGSPLAYHIKTPRPKSKPPLHPPGEEALTLITPKPRVRNQSHRFTHRARKPSRSSHQGPASEIKATVSPAGRGSPLAYHSKAFSSSSSILLFLHSTLSRTTRRAFRINRIRVSRSSISVMTG
ncbi:Uncharacterised protein [Bacteroides pyogenes]|nr:Uncharacterised protein [Bacteroides pyogenes]